MYDNSDPYLSRGVRTQETPENLLPADGSSGMERDASPAVPVQPPAANPDNIPVAPLPPVVGNPEPNPDNIPVAPLPPVVGNPELNPDNIPVAPLPPIIGNPELNPDNIPVAPLPPIVGYPNQNCTFCLTRFLHAAAGYGPLNVIVGNRVAAVNLSYMEVSDYNSIPDGFYTVTISSTRNPSTIFFRGRIPFSAGEKITMAIVKSVNGLDLVRISDQPCRILPANRGCVRAVNLIYDSPAMDVIFTDGRAAFSDVRFKEVTSYKQARPGEYDFYVARTPNVTQTEPLVSSYVVVKAGEIYTIYLFGDWDGSNQVLVKVIS